MGDSNNDVLQQISDLDLRLSRIEQTLNTLGVKLAPDKDLVPSDSPSGSPRAVPRPEAAISQTPGPVTPIKNAESIETRIGSHFFNRIGILAVLIGIAWYLKFAFENQWVGPTGRVATGILAGALLIAWSEWFRKKGHVKFSYSLKAIGSGALYMSLWTAYDRYDLISSSVAFSAMLLVTAWNGFICWVQDSEVLALYALVGGLATPVLASTGGDHQIALCVYMLILNIAVLALLSRKPWVNVAFGAFVGTVLLFWGWAEQYYSDSQFWTTALFVTVFTVLFALIPSILKGDLDGRPKGKARALLPLLSVVNAGVGFLAFYGMLGYGGREWARPWVAVLFAAFYLAVIRFRDEKRESADTKTTAALHLVLAVTFLTIAIPLKAQEGWIAIGWFVEGAGLLWVARRSQSELLRPLGIIAMMLGVFALNNISESSITQVILNSRFAGFVVGIAAFAFIARMAFDVYALHSSESNSQVTPEFFRDAFLAELRKDVASWRNIAIVAALAVNVLVLWGVSLEITTFWNTQPYVTDVYRHFSLSIWWMLFGALLLVIGFKKRSRFFRWQGLVLLALSVFKVFLFDMSELTQGYRIVSFIGLGVILLTTSFAYQKDWFGIRRGDDHDADQGVGVQ